MLGEVATVAPKLSGAFKTVMAWADEPLTGKQRGRLVFGNGDLTEKDGKRHVNDVVPFF